MPSARDAFCLRSRGSGAVRGKESVKCARVAYTLFFWAAERLAKFGKFLVRVEWPIASSQRKLKLDTVAATAHVWLSLQASGRFGQGAPT